MNKRLIDIIVGARPNFMKVAPIIRAIDDLVAAGSDLSWRLVHTGQHYDKRMSDDFFQQLGIPQPHVNLGAGSGTAAEQTASIMIGYESLLRSTPSDMCLVVGDVTSTMACAIVAQKLQIAVCHIEGGIRSSDWTMPEEINRLVTDAITNHFFTTSAFANSNLRAAGVSDDRIHFVGNTMIDTLMANMGRLREPAFCAQGHLTPGCFFVVTLHRPGNVDSPENLARLLRSIALGSGGLPVVFPVHPRTAKAMLAIGELPSGFVIVDPQPYLEFNWLVKNSRAVITDSGGVTEETTVMGIPCMTLRDSTERPETVTIGTNELIGTDPRALGPALERLAAGKWKKGAIPELWDGNAAVRIVAILDRIVGTPLARSITAR
jgi:UDP-N-acetylglucosamine 2-epimerase (non-hydrolysing)